MKPVIEKVPLEKTIREQYKHFCKSFLEGIPVSLKIHNRWILPITNVSITETTSIIGNLCTFSCPKCDSKPVFESWRSIVRHISHLHQEKTFFSASSSLAVTARYHACLLCPVAILSDRVFLTNHLKMEHEMKLSKYESVFKKHGGKILPTYPKYLKEKEDALQNI